MLAFNAVGSVTVPIVSSNPHFLYGAERYVNAVVGMNPNQTGLTTDIDIEPVRRRVACSALSDVRQTNRSKI